MDNGRYPAWVLNEKLLRSKVIIHTPTDPKEPNQLNLTAVRKTGTICVFVLFESLFKIGGKLMNIALWIVQILFGLYFFAIGVIHFIVPPGLPAPMAWMYDLSPWLHWVSGIAEILGGLGLILPGIFRMQTRLVPLAATGLALVMIGAVIYHVTRGEFQNVVTNLILIAIMAFIAYGRTKLAPLSDRNAAAV